MHSNTGMTIMDAALRKNSPGLTGFIMLMTRADIQYSVRTATKGLGASGDSLFLTLSEGNASVERPRDFLTTML